LFAAASPKHPDGSACPEGTQSVPRAFIACCPEFRAHTLSCYHDVRYEWWPKQRCWFTVIAPSAGGGGVEISFCPHCGSRLSKRKSLVRAPRCGLIWRRCWGLCPCRDGRGLCAQPPRPRQSAVVQAVRRRLILQAIRRTASDLCVSGWSRSLSNGVPAALTELDETRRMLDEWP
jgi:hypothetical protein